MFIIIIIDIIILNEINIKLLLTIKENIMWKNLKFAIAVGLEISMHAQSFKL